MIIQVLAGLKNTELGFLPNGENYKTSITVLPDGRTVRYNGECACVVY